MKKIFTTIIMFSSAFFVVAQNVGIGESQPGSKGAIKGNLSVGEDYSTLPAPAQGAIIQGVVGIGTSTPDSKAILDISSTTQGVLFPRMTETERNAIVSPPSGLQVFNTSSNCLEFFVGGNWQPVSCACITAPASVGIINGTSTNLCINTNYTYTIGAVAGASTYSWTFPAGTTILSGNNTTAVTVSFANTAGASISVIASNSCGSSNPTTLPITFTPIPATPGTITASATQICSNQANINLSIAAIANATSYEWTVPSGATITNGNGTPNAVTTWGTVAGNVNVSAIGCNGQSANNTLAISLPVPTAPASNAATTIGNTSFTANWTGVSFTPSVISYRLDVSTASDFSSFVSGYQDLDVGNVTSRNVTGLTCGTTYYYRVRAVNCNGAGANSATQTVSLRCQNCLQIKTNYPASASGNYTIDPDGTGPIAPISCYCDMVYDGGGWTKLNQSLTGGISVSKGNASWSGDNIVGTGNAAGGCGSPSPLTPLHHTIPAPIITFSGAYILLTRGTTILQCSSFTGTYATGYFTPPFTGPYTTYTTCAWGDTAPLWARACCNPLRDTRPANFVFLSSANNASGNLQYTQTCLDATDNGAFTIQWFVR